MPRFATIGLASSGQLSVKEGLIELFNKKKSVLEAIPGNRDSIVAKRSSQSAASI
jgi:hypothetical protein